MLTGMWAQEKYIFQYAPLWFKNCAYRLVVPVLASNYKQHILSPAEVTKVCHSLAELYAK
jgi:hypothetical protein